METNLHTTVGWLSTPFVDADFTPPQHSRRGKLRTLLLLLLLLLPLLALFDGLSTALAQQQQQASTVDTTHANHKAANNAPLDRSGKARKGTASYYGKKFYSKKMADGTRMNPQSNVAASKTLPIGTQAKITNLDTGASAVVVIKDRGPYVKDRIVDVSPKTADKLGLKENGTAPVEVKPVEVPQSDGSVKPGAGAVQTPGGK
ncbi:septal ring lytic transglycosylase RlpA family protein [Paraburkholderia sp. BL21I4N1]|uniref:septal ring lytic transglycosylase RlpA family protein n=1 Tax=Paraburkholderia sp. BL21I4N1 TaxID=1938801 RepID=UPI000CFAF54C|nr:septal ring lytic transglycosylase RlpA family protein [Paraburkholderia sp. BL21I4N1]PQV53961.1 rare lipoprotein A [Paraburkholderia sp. BL21I4N1]